MKCVRVFFFSIHPSDRLVRVNGYPIVSEKPVAPVRSNTMHFVQSKKKTKKTKKNENKNKKRKTTTAEWPGRGGGGGAREAESREWKEMGERCERGR